MNGSLLAIFAHPDDESYRAGGTLALLSQQGVEVRVICATGGAWGLPRLPRKEAIKIRKEELRCACRALSIHPPFFMNYQDGSLSQVPEGKAISHLTGIIRSLQPDALLTWPPHGISGHIDHQMISDWTRKSFLQAANPRYQYDEQPAHTVTSLYHLALPHSTAQRVGFTHLHSIPDDEITLTLDIHSVWDRKMAAIRCHQSQIAHSPILAEREDKREAFLRYEHFKRIYHNAEGEDLLTQLQVIENHGGRKRGRS